MENNKQQASHCTYQSDNGSISSGGLTKLEYFSAMAMQGLIGQNTFAKYFDGTLPKELAAKTCIEFAKELLNQLENIK